MGEIVKLFFLNQQIIFLKEPAACEIAQKAKPQKEVEDGATTILLKGVTLGKSGGSGDGVQLMVAFLSISFYYLAPGLLRYNLDKEGSTLPRVVEVLLPSTALVELVEGFSLNLLLILPPQVARVVLQLILVFEKKRSFCLQHHRWFGPNT